MIPSHVPLGETAEFINGAAFKPSDWTSTGLPIIRIQNLTDAGKPYNRTQRSVPPSLYVQPGDLLVSWSATLGVFEWAGPECGVLNQHIFRVVPKLSRVYKPYLGHVLRVALRQMQQHLHGATMQHVNRAEFLSTPVFLPSLAEQRRIAEVLDCANGLRAKRRAILAQLDNLVLSTFIEWLGPDDRARRQPLSMAFSEPPTYGSMIPPSDRGSWLTLRVGNIQDARLDLSDRKYISLPISARARHSVRDGDLLMARAIASQSHLGKCIVAQPGGNEWAFDSHLMRIRLNPQVLMPEFFRRWLLTPVGRVAFLGVTRRSSVQFNVNTKEIDGLRVPTPPIADQRRFVRFESETERARNALEKSLTHLDTLFASLEHRAFRGEL